MTIAHPPLFLSSRLSQNKVESSAGERDLVRRQGQLRKSCPSWHILITLSDTGEGFLVLTAKSIVKLINKGVSMCCNFLIINLGLTISWAGEVKDFCINLEFSKVMLEVFWSCLQGYWIIFVKSQKMYWLDFIYIPRF